MTVAACIIAADEDADFWRCQRSLGGVDVVVQRFMKKVEHFAAARNALLADVDTDWWFYIDADEALEGDVARLCSLLPDSVDGCLIPVNNLSADDGETGTIGSTAQQFRLVRNHIGARFEGRIHEQIVLPDGRLPVLAHVEGLSITHWGYLPDRLKGKHIRNLTLLRKAIEDDPENAYHHHQFGVQHSTVQDFDQALAAFHTAIRLWQKDCLPLPFVPAMFTAAIVAALRTRQFDLAVGIAASAPKEAFTPDYFYYTALAALELGLVDDAHDLLVRGREATVDPHFHDANTQARIALALEKI